MKDITIDYLYETSEEDGSKTIHAYGLNGNVYRLNLPMPDKLAELKKAAIEEAKEEPEETPTKLRKPEAPILADTRIRTPIKTTQTPNRTATGADYA